MTTTHRTTTTAYNRKKKRWHRSPPRGTDHTTGGPLPRPPVPKARGSMMLGVTPGKGDTMQNVMTGNELWRRMLASLAALATVLTAAALAAPAAEALPYGPYTCQNGYVWREAFANDQVCVTPTDRSTVAQENAAGPYHTNPYTAYPYSCRSGYVWRQAKPTDYVLVVPASRDRERANHGTPNHASSIPHRPPMAICAVRRTPTVTCTPLAAP